LFEILTLQPLHPRGPFEEIVQAIVAGVEARASVRAPEANVPPELEELCVAATRRAPSERVASALAFSQVLEAYLDSEHDEELRRKSSAEHAAKGKRYAEQALAVAPAPRGGSAALDSSLRAQALREIGRALALDASNKGALATFVQLLTTPPRVVPEEVLVAQRADWSKQIQVGALAIIGCEVALILWGLLLYLMEVRDGWRLAQALGVFLASGIAGLVTRLRPSLLPLLVSCVLSLIGCVLATSTIASFTPVIAGLLVAQVNLFSLVSRLWFRVGIVSFAALCWAAIVYGPTWGLLPQTTRVSGGDIVLHSPVLAFEPTWFPLWTFGAVLVTMVVTSVAVGEVRSAFRRAEDLQRLQAWQLRQLVADDAS
jgi:serine/threonine-protein kinase